MMAKMLVLFLAAILTVNTTGWAEQRNPNTDWLQKAGYGVFVHYLEDLQNAPETVNSLGRKTSWEECVRAFDVPRFAAQMAEAGAGYVIFTMHQRTRFLIAPNATFDRITGYKPGEGCATRDLVKELYDALREKNIPLMLYWTGDGPRQDPKAGPAMGCSSTVTTEFVRKWASVVEEYSKRYGEKVAGWWVDGCYPFIGYNEEKLAILARALKAGNPKAVVALNPGVLERVSAYSLHEDFTTGEMNEFRDQPASRWVKGEQWHILSFLGSDWGRAGVRYGKTDLVEYVADVNRAGGVVSIDVLLFRDGALDRSQLEVLKALRPGLALSRARTPTPPGNLAFRKPARLLSLDGSHALAVNSGTHFAKLGVDGDPKTFALAGNEWPWSYEVDLLESRNLRRIKVTFPKTGYATELHVSVQAEGGKWSIVGSGKDLAGAPFECTFEPTKARVVRVSALKPNGPNQKGGQMAVSELEVYE